MAFIVKGGASDSASVVSWMWVGANNPPFEARVRRMCDTGIYGKSAYSWF